MIYDSGSVLLNWLSDLYLVIQYYSDLTCGSAGVGVRVGEHASKFGVYVGFCFAGRGAEETLILVRIVETLRSAPPGLTYTTVVL